jgi:dihydrofolate reductase
MAESGGLLLGRRSYEDMLSYWNTQSDSPFTDALNTAPKYVASRSLREPLPWPKSTLLDGDAADAVAELRKQPGKDLHVMRSGWCRGVSVIDEYMLMIHPLVFGSGRRLFLDASPLTLRLVDSKAKTTGLVMATYQPEEGWQLVCSREVEFRDDPDS